MAALLYASRLPACPYEIVLVASNDPAAPGLALAEAEGIATFAQTHRGLEREAHEAIIQRALEKSGAQVVALCGYMRILTAGFVAQWDGRMVNTHPSLLPKYRGLDTHARALAAGDSQAGCSVHIVTPELDEGPLLGQMAVAIHRDDTPETLGRRVQMAEYQLYPRMLAQFVTGIGDAAASAEVVQPLSPGSQGAWRQVREAATRLTGVARAQAFARIGLRGLSSSIMTAGKPAGRGKPNGLIGRCLRAVTLWFARGFVRAARSDRRSPGSSLDAERIAQ